MPKFTILNIIASTSTDWISTVLILLLGIAAILAIQRLGKVSIAQHCPPTLLVGWPLVGCADFFHRRAEFLVTGCGLSQDGHFCFRYGMHLIVALSGADARASFFSTRGLDPSAGYSALLTGIPSTDHLEGGGINSRTFKTFKLLMTKARLVENIGQLVNDANSALGHLETSRPFDPFNGIYLLIYQMTHRLLGSYDVANSPRLLAETLAVYDRMGDSSAMQTMFPMMPTLGMLRKLCGGARLHFLFRSIIRDRRKCGRRENDAMQIMMDNGDSDIQISTVIISSLFAGLLNSGVNAAWILCYLASHRDWYMKIQAEVDEVIATGRQSDDETPLQILQRLTIAQWESSFPLLGYALQESIRLNLPGVFIRKNITNVDLPLIGTNIIVPRGSFAVYLADDVHLNQDLYPEPLEWNPCRHIQSSSDSRESSSLDYLGWGAGLHPCLGKRFAKLEVAISTAMFMSTYEFELCDGAGKLQQGSLPRTNRNWHGAKPIKDKVYFKLTSRHR